MSNVYELTKLHVSSVANLKKKKQKQKPSCFKCLPLVRSILFILFICRFATMTKFENSIYLSYRKFALKTKKVEKLIFKFAFVCDQVVLWR